MSTYENHVFYCLQCGSKINHNLLVGMHITRLPKVREAILQEKFQHVECRNCQFVNRVEKQSIYTDFERNHYVAVELPVVCDWRNPDVIRVAPHPLFNRYIEIYDFVKILKKAIVQ